MESDVIHDKLYEEVGHDAMENYYKFISDRTRINNLAQYDLFCCKDSMRHLKITPVASGGEARLAANRGNARHNGRGHF